MYIDGDSVVEDIALVLIYQYFSEYVMLLVLIYSVWQRVYQIYSDEVVQLIAEHVLLVNRVSTCCVYSLSCHRSVTTKRFSIS
jgi:hypothetical protein